MSEKSLQGRPYHITSYTHTHTNTHTQTPMNALPPQVSWVIIKLNNENNEHDEINYTENWKHIIALIEMRRHFRCREYRPAAMSGVDLCVVCNSDAETEAWSSYVVEQASSTSGSASVSSCTLLDTDLSRLSSVDTLRTARVVVVIVSLGHLDYLRTCPGDGDPVYSACSPEHSLIILCGVSEDDLEKSQSVSGRKISYHFPRYSSWQCVQYNVQQSVLAEKLKTLISEARSAAVELVQTTARCEVWSCQCGFKYRLGLL